MIKPKLIKDRSAVASYLTNRSVDHLMRKISEITIWLIVVQRLFKIDADTFQNLTAT